jgi:hypothetical protein
MDSSIQANPNTLPQTIDASDICNSHATSSIGTRVAPGDTGADPFPTIQRGKTWPLHGFVNEATEGYNGPVTERWANGEEQLESPWARKIILSFGKCHATLPSEWLLTGLFNAQMVAVFEVIRVSSFFRLSCAKSRRSRHQTINTGPLFARVTPILGTWSTATTQHFIHATTSTI